jgi:hypothetical protein
MSIENEKAQPLIQALHHSRNNSKTDESLWSEGKSGAHVTNSPSLRPATPGRAARQVGTVVPRCTREMRSGACQRSAHAVIVALHDTVRSASMGAVFAKLGGGGGCGEAFREGAVVLEAWQVS